MKMAIIGTAGRGSAITRLDKKVYNTMVAYAIKYANELGISPEDLVLVSGGAAWADHVAVSIFLHGRGDNDKPQVCKGLELHLPAPFLMDPAAYENTQCGRTANGYHRQFAKKVTGDGRRSLSGIKKAISLGAQVTVYDGPGYSPFFTRNSEVAKADIVLAYTFGVGDAPQDGGTKDTWNKAVKNGCKTMRHMSLAALEGGKK